MDVAMARPNKKRRFQYKYESNLQFTDQLAQRQTVDRLLMFMQSQALRWLWLMERGQESNNEESWKYGLLWSNEQPRHGETIPLWSPGATRAAHKGINWNNIFKTNVIARISIYRLK